MSRETITAIEVGSSALKLLMAEPADNDSMRVLGALEVSTLSKVVKGEVVNAPDVARLLEKGLDELEHKAQHEVVYACVAVTGSHVETQNITAMMPITSPTRRIDEDLVAAVTRQVRTYQPSSGREKIHSIQRRYLIDGRYPTGDPTGMTGNQLTADVHLVHGDTNRLAILHDLIAESGGLQSYEVAFSPIAAYYGLHQRQSQTGGSLIVDLGAGTTGFALYCDGGCMHSGVITVGCEHLANDLAIGLKLPLPKCRELVRRHAGAMRNAAGLSTDIVIDRSSVVNKPRHIRLSKVQTIVEVRLTELFEVIAAELDHADVRRFLSNGITLVGGGALIPDVCELAERILQAPVRVGLPSGLTAVSEDLNSPRWVTPVGLLHLGQNFREVEDAASLPFKETIKRDLVRLKDLLFNSINI